MAHAVGKIGGAIFDVAVLGTGRTVREIVFPPSCAGCSRRTDRHGALCVSCWSSVPFIERPYCEILGQPFSYDPGTGSLCADAIAEPPVFDRLRSVALHDGLVRDLVHQLKYQDKIHLAPMMAGWMYRAARGEVDACDAILPVPLHRSRLVARRFNQSAELARHLAKLSGKPLVSHALVRRRRTDRQVGLSATARKSNVRGAFAVAAGRESEVFGRRLILVDDVYTTGATVSAATRALKRAGAVEVIVLTFAMALSGPI